VHTIAHNCIHAQIYKIIIYTPIRPSAIYEKTKYIFSDHIQLFQYHMPNRKINYL